MHLEREAGERVDLVLGGALARRGLRGAANGKRRRLSRWRLIQDRHAKARVHIRRLRVARLAAEVACAHEGSR